MAPIAPLVVRSGSVVIHVNDPSQLAGAMAALGGLHGARGVGAAVSALVAASECILKTTAAAHFDHSFRSLRDVVHFCRTSLPRSEVKFPQQLHGAYSLSRHTPEPEVRSRCSRIATVIKGGAASAAEDWQRDTAQVDPRATAGHTAHGLA